jgi:hypothetical protein
MRSPTISQSRAGKPNGPTRCSRNCNRALCEVSPWDYGWPPRLCNRFRFCRTSYTDANRHRARTFSKCAPIISPNLLTDRNPREKRRGPTLSECAGPLEGAVHRNCLKRQEIFAGVMSLNGLGFPNLARSCIGSAISLTLFRFDHVSRICFAWPFSISQ